MDDSNQNYAPYGPSPNVIQVVRHIRKSVIPGAINVKLLERIGIPEGNIGRTLRALRFLHLIDEQGNLTPDFEALRRASTLEYNKLFANLIRNAYKEVFEVVNPTEESYQDIDDAFRNYTPQAQRTRMVSLFIGLCKEVGIIMRDIEPVTSRRTGVSTSKSPSKYPYSSRHTSIEQGNTQHTVSQQLIPQQIPNNPSSESLSNNDTYYARIWDFVKLGLPPNRRGTLKERELLIQAFTVGIDLVIKWTDKEGEGQDDIKQFQEV